MAVLACGRTDSVLFWCGGFDFVSDEVVRAVFQIDNIQSLFLKIHHDKLEGIRGSDIQMFALSEAKGT